MAYVFVDPSSLGIPSTVPVGMILMPFVLDDGNGDWHQGAYTLPVMLKVSKCCRYIYRVDPQGYFGLNKTTPIAGPPAAIEFDVGAVSSTGDSLAYICSPATPANPVFAKQASLRTCNFSIVRGVDMHILTHF